MKTLHIWQFPRHSEKLEFTDLFLQGPVEHTKVYFFFARESCTLLALKMAFDTRVTLGTFKHNRAIQGSNSKITNGSCAQAAEDRGLKIQSQTGSIVIKSVPCHHNTKPKGMRRLAPRARQTLRESKYLLQFYSG